MTTGSGTKKMYTLDMEIQYIIARQKDTLHRFPGNGRTPRNINTLLSFAKRNVIRARGKEGKGANGERVACYGGQKNSIAPYG